MNEHRRADDALPVDPDLAPGRPAGSTTDGRSASTSGTPASRRTELSILAAIAVGGALGASGRYGVAQLVHVTPDTFPWATFWTNISGSFALGLLLAFVLERFPPSRYLRPFAATGFLGAYTTYSTFAVETVMLIRSGHVPIAVAYTVSSLLAGFVAVWAGIVAARAAPLPGRGDPGIPARARRAHHRGPRHRRRG